MNRKEEEMEPIHRFYDEGGSYGIEEMLIKAKGEERKRDIETKDHRFVCFKSPIGSYFTKERKRET